MIDFLFIAHLKIRLWQCAQFEVNAWCCAGQKLLRSDTLWQKQIRQKWLKSAWILYRCSLTHNLKLAHLHTPSSESAEAWTPFERFVQGGGQHLALVLTISYLVVSTKCCRLQTPGQSTFSLKTSCDLMFSATSNFCRMQLLILTANRSPFELRLTDLCGFRKHKNKGQCSWCSWEVSKMHNAAAPNSRQISTNKYQISHHFSYQQNCPILLPIHVDILSNLEVSLWQFRT